MKLLSTLVLLGMLGACSSNPHYHAKKAQKVNEEYSHESSQFAQDDQFVSAETTNHHKDFIIRKPASNYSSVEKELTCSLHKDKRLLVHNLLTNGGCVVNYKKYGELAQVAKARNGKAYCEKVFNKIKGNLMKAGYNCE